MAWNDLTNPEAWKLALANLLRKGEDVGTYISEAPEKAGKAIVEAGQRQSALMDKAFDPTGKTLIRDPKAANQAAMNLLEGPLSVAPVGMTKLISPQSEAMEIAQKNAALPISKGGLGLPPNNTAMDRAKALGYETPVYHGTNADINAFNVEGKGKTSGAGAFFTTNPITAETYVSASGEGNIIPALLKKDDFLTANAKGRNWADIWTDQLAAKSKGKKYNLDDLSLDKHSATSTDELGMIAKELGLKGTHIKNVKDLGPNSHVMRAKEYLLEKYGIVPDATWSNVTGKQFDEAQKAMKKFYGSQKGDIYAIQDPSLIRSKFAAFDPKRINEADILAGAAPLGLLADEDTRKEILQKLFNKQENKK